MTSIISTCYIFGKYSTPNIIFQNFAKKGGPLQVSGPPD